MDKQIHAGVHRFRDSVAVHLGDGSTVYLSAEQAESLADALSECAADIKRYTFYASPFNKREFQFEGKR